MREASLSRARAYAPDSDSGADKVEEFDVLKRLNVDSIKDLRQMGRELKEFLREGISTSRSNVVMVRVRDDVSKSIDALVEAELFRSRSEAAAFLIRKGLVATSELFKDVMDKTAEIHRLKMEIRSIIGLEANDIPIGDVDQSDESES